MVCIITNMSVYICNIKFSDFYWCYKTASIHVMAQARVFLSDIIPYVQYTHGFVNNIYLHKKIDHFVKETDTSGYIFVLFYAQTRRFSVLSGMLINHL